MPRLETTDMKAEWKKVRLETIAEIERSSIQPESICQGTAYLGLEHIESGGLILGAKPVDAGELESSKFKFTKHHVLYGKLRPYLAKIALPDFNGICSTDILPILPGSDLDRRFLCYFLRQPTMVKFANSRAAGANLPRLGPSVLSRFLIPFPPLPEQRRIADVLERAEALRAKRRAALAELDALTQSFFLDMFGDPARNTKGLPTFRLGLLGHWQSGGTPSRTRDDFFQGSIPWFSSGELDDVIVMRSKEHISSTALRETSARAVPKGALMLGMYDTAALKASFAGIDCSCNQAIAFAKLDETLTHPLFVFHAVVIGREHFRRLQRGVRQKNLNLSMIRDIAIPNPTLSLQREFADRVAAVEKLKAAQRASLAELDELFASLQHKAFRGEL